MHKRKTTLLIVNTIYLTLVQVFLRNLKMMATESHNRYRNCNPNSPSSNTIDTNKNETNDLIDSKKESPQNKPKKKKCYLLCFYNCKFNDDSEVN